MSLHDLIRARRSIRRFHATPLRDTDVYAILDAARLAPSGGNRQRWKFIYVKDPQVLRMVKNCSPGFYGEAPAAIIAGIDVEESIEATPSRQIVSILDIGFAAENLILTAQALGIGSCPIASFNVACIKSILQAPATYRPLLVFSLGYPLDIPVSPPKERFEDIVYLDIYGVPWKVLEE